MNCSVMTGMATPTQSMCAAEMAATVSGKLRRQARMSVAEATARCWTRTGCVGPPWAGSSKPKLRASSSPIAAPAQNPSASQMSLRRSAAVGAGRTQGSSTAKKRATAAVMPSRPAIPTGYAGPPTPLLRRKMEMASAWLRQAPAA